MVLMWIQLFFEIGTFPALLVKSCTVAGFIWLLTWELTSGNSTWSYQLFFLTNTPSPINIAPSPSWSASLPLWEDHGRGQGEGRPTISLPFVWLEDMGSNCHLSGANMKYGWPLLVSWQCWSLFDEMELFLSGSLMAATCVKPYWEQKNIVRRKTQKWEHTFALFLLCIMCKNLSDYNHLKYIKKSNEAE